MVAGMKVNVHWSGLGEEGQFGVHLDGTGFTPSQASVEAVASDIQNAIQSDVYAAQLKAMLATDQAYDRVTVYWYNDLAAPSVYGAESPFSGGGMVGTGASLMPLQSALVCTLRTGHLGASYRGRIYLPATGAGLSTGHQYSDTFVTAVAEMVAGTDLKEGLLWDMARSVDSEGDGGCHPVVYSPKLGILTDITSVTVDSLPDTQRRRRESAVPLHTHNAPYATFTG